MPEEERDIRLFLTRAVSMVEEASNLGVRITLRWLFQNMNSHDALDQDQIYAINEALTKVCKHDMHNHGGNVFRGGSICWTCGVLAE